MIFKLILHVHYITEYTEDKVVIECKINNEYKSVTINRDKTIVIEELPHDEFEFVEFEGRVSLSYEITEFGVRLIDTEYLKITDKGIHVESDSDILPAKVELFGHCTMVSTQSPCCKGEIHDTKTVRLFIRYGGEIYQHKFKEEICCDYSCNKRCNYEVKKVPTLSANYKPCYHKVAVDIIRGYILFKSNIDDDVFNYGNDNGELIDEDTGNYLGAYTRDGGDNYYPSGYIQIYDDM